MNLYNLIRMLLLWESVKGNTTIPVANVNWLANQIDKQLKHLPADASPEMLYTIIRTTLANNGVVLHEWS
jgi:hypothetical protein